MTTEQKKAIQDIGIELKRKLPSFFGSVKFNFSGDKRDVKIRISEMAIAKQDFVKP